MSNRWGIPDWLEKKVRARDKYCVYCPRKLTKKIRTFEHIDNDGGPTEDNICMCCNSCNSSKGTKKLLSWLNSPYCAEKKISKNTVAGIIKKYIKVHSSR